MIIVLLCIMFSSTLNFHGLTLVSLALWFNVHPFLAMFAIGEVFSSTNYITNNCKCAEKHDKKS